LARIRLGIELMQGDSDPQRRAQLEKDIADLDGLIEQILLSSRLDSVGIVGVPEEVDLLALAAEEAARYEHSSVIGNSVTVAGDRGLLQRMVRNLLDNAERHGAPPIRIDVELQGGDAVMTVSDHGSGINERDRDRIFTPFYRPPGSKGGGAGLGLALARQIARQHGGDAAWAPSGQMSSAIRVRIPAHSQDADASDSISANL
jgi:signal transduction histidine kinase